MNDPLGLEASGLPPELIAQLMGSRSRKMIAEAMLKQSMQAPEVAQPKGRFQGVVSPLEHLAKLTGGVVARGNIGREEKAQAAVGQQAEQGRNAALDAYLAQKRGLPGVLPNDDEGNPMPNRADPRGAIENAQRSPYLRTSPFIRDERLEMGRTEDREDKQAFLKSQAEEARKSREAQAEADRANRLEMLKDRLAAEERAGRDSRETRLLIAQLGRGMRQEPAPSLTQIVDPTNPKQMLSINAREYKGGGVGSPGVIGIAGKEPAAAKQAEGIDAGRATVSELVGTLRGYYDNLKEAGDIADPSQGAVANTLARLQSSAVGQAVGSAVGTKSQSQRESIEMTRPLLLNAIRSATGMSARQMDSNRELQLYLAAATDPTKGYAANIRALEMLDKLYGIGGGAGGAKPAAGVPAGVDPADWAAMTPEEKALWAK